MKLLFLLVCVSFSFTTFSKECQVYGISDSPQKYDCRINGSTFLLRCRDGQYFLNSQKIKQAYHMEVEKGSVPLVFEASGVKLTILIQSKTDVLAELETGEGLERGSCK